MADTYIAPGERTFDRLPSLNARRLALFPLADVVPDRPLRAYTWRGVQTNQGREGACVGHGVTGEAAARPKPIFGDPVYRPPDPEYVNQVAHDVYKAAQLVDEFPQTPATSEGTSVDAGMRMGLQRGWWDEFRWGQTAYEVALWVAYKGPVVAGGFWRSGMDTVDGDGFATYSGSKRGGHCFLWTRIRSVRGRWGLWTPNSWGGAGQMFLDLDAVDAFLADDGEAATPVNRHLVRA
jgi:hypothetical protein